MSASRHSFCRREASFLASALRRGLGSAGGSWPLPPCVREVAPVAEAEECEREWRNDDDDDDSDGCENGGGAVVDRDERERCMDALVGVGDEV